MTETTGTGPLAPRYGDTATLGRRDGRDCVATFASLEHEHRRLRSGVGITDYSHYGKFLLTGPQAVDLANRVSLLDVLRLPIHKIAPSFILNPDASVLCESYVVNRGDGYLLLTEGCEPADVLACIEEERARVGGPVEIVDLTDATALIGLDGPFSWELAKEFFGMRILGVRYLDVVQNQSIDDVEVTVYRAGKTGEFGYWIQCDAERAVEVWDRLVEEGAQFDLRPCGYEAVELCKLENRFVNMTREGAGATHVLELNTRILIDREKDAYRGSEPVLEAAVDRRLVGLHLAADATAPEPGAEVRYRGQPIGRVENSGYSYTLGRPIAVAFLDAEYAFVGLDYDVASAGTAQPARTVSAPFVLNRSLEIRPQEHSYFDEP